MGYEMLFWVLLVLLVLNLAWLAWWMNTPWLACAYCETKVKGRYFMLRHLSTCAGKKC